MLPVKSLDDQMFGDILNNAKKMISKYYPDWTDENYHDPGITFLELFAWLKEMQQFYIDQPGDKNYLKFMKLLGSGLRRAQPASVLMQVYNADEEAFLPENAGMAAGDIIFETKEPAYLVANEIKSVSYTSVITGETKRIDDYENLQVKFNIFGNDPTAGDFFCVELAGPLPVGREIGLYTEIFYGNGAKRNPIITGDFYRLAEIEWEYLTAGGFRKLAVTDGTHAFLQDGYVYFTVDAEMARDEQSGAYIIRGALKENEYDVFPVVSRFRLNTVLAVQKRTIAECVDKYVSDGVLELCNSLFLTGDVEIYVSDGGGAFMREESFRVECSPEKGVFRCFLDKKELGIKAVAHKKDTVRPVEKADGSPYFSFTVDTGYEKIVYGDFDILVCEAANGFKFYEWEKVGDFDASVATSRHYVLDEEKGTVAFGNGLKGMCPEGDIYVVSLSFTKGANGNVKKEEVTALCYPYQKADVINYDHAFGGMEKETIDEAFLRVRKELAGVSRAVTKKDYETLVAGTPGLMIESAKVVKIKSKHGRLTNPNCADIVVKPYDPYPDYTGVTLNGAYIKNILRHLEKYKLISTEIKIHAPVYVGFEIIGEVQADAFYKNAGDMINETVRRFLERIKNEFGYQILYSDIYSVIETLECVRKINLLQIDAEGRYAVRNENGDILLPENGLAYLKKLRITVSESGMY